MKAATKRVRKLKASDYAMLSFASFYIENGTNYRLDKWLRVRPPKGGNPKITACRVVGELLTWAAKCEHHDDANWPIRGVREEALEIVADPAAKPLDKEFAVLVLVLYETHNVPLLPWIGRADEVDEALQNEAQTLLHGNREGGAF